MKKVTRILGLCALVALATVSCKKDDNNAPQGGKSFRATINQPTDGAKTHIGAGNYLMWNSGDAIKVYTADGTSAEFTTTADDVYENAEFTGDIKEADKYVAFYPAAKASDAQDGYVTLTLDDQQTYVENNFANGAYPMAAYWEGNAGDDVDFQFHSPCAVVCLPLTGNAKVTSIDLSGKKLTDVLAGTLNVNINNFDPANPSAGGYSPVSVSLNCGNGVQLGETPTNFYFVVAAPNAIFTGGLKFVVNYEGGSETLETTENNSLSAETILTMPAKEVKKPVPPIGYFTVNPSGKKVTFAPGNLWYDGSNTGKEWRFEDHQWDSHCEDVNPDALGLFCWSHENNNYGRDMQDAEGNYLNGSEFKDWGQLAICKPGSKTEQYAENEWRTLRGHSDTDAMGEIDYVMSYRESLYDKTLHAKKTVHGVNCLVLAPDNYTGNIESASWDELEEAGSVAIPLTGHYDKFYQEQVGEEPQFLGQGSKVWLWGSNLKSGLGTTLYFDGNIQLQESATILFRNAVRLVKDVEDVE